jgi:serine phosphatase RsbU (regulator of sigma subunit)
LKQRISKLEDDALKKGQAQKESEIMDDVGKDLQPQKSPQIEGYDTAYFSAKLDGASFYDLFELDDGNIVLLMANVSGKGFSAAMRAYLTKTLIRTYSRKYQNPADILREVNLHINEISGNGMMITCFCGILDPFDDFIEYANAGHAFPFLVSSQGSVDTLTGGGIALGALDHINLQSDSISVNSGDVLVIYSDDLAEITNEWSEPFGTERLITLVKDNIEDAASEITKKVEKSIKVHARNHALGRNCSLMVLKKNP